MSKRFKQLEDGSVIFEEGCVVNTNVRVVEEIDVSDLSHEELEQLRNRPSEFRVTKGKASRPRVTRKP